SGGAARRAAPGLRGGGRDHGCGRRSGPGRAAHADQALSRPTDVGGRPSAKRRAPRRRRWRPAHLAGYGAVVLLLGLALFLVARSAVRSPASTPIAQSAGAIVAYPGDHH